MSTNIGFKQLPCRKKFQTEFNKRALKHVYALIWWSISVSLRSFRQNGVFLSHISGSISNLNYSTNETKLLTDKTKKNAESNRKKTKRQKSRDVDSCIDFEACHE